MPWNVPQFVTMTKLAPALLAGCPVVLKPAPETPLDAFVLAEIAETAGLPAGLLNIVPAGREVGEHLVRHPGIDKVAFTGSTAAGRAIASICGEQLKRCSLELGGKSAADHPRRRRHRSRHDGGPQVRVVDEQRPGLRGPDPHPGLAGRSATTRWSRPWWPPIDGMQPQDRRSDPIPSTEIGPLVAQRQQERVEKYIALGQEEGARVVVGGNGAPAGHETGWFVQPTLFANVSNDMRIAREEIFGPVISVIPYDDEADALRIANDSDYGLAGSVWTADVDHGVDIARRVRTGTYGVNNGSGMDLAHRSAASRHRASVVSSGRRASTPTPSTRRSASPADTRRSVIRWHHISGHLRHVMPAARPGPGRGC